MSTSLKRKFRDDDFSVNYFSDDDHQLPPSSVSQMNNTVRPSDLTKPIATAPDLNFQSRNFCPPPTPDSDDQTSDKRCEKIEDAPVPFGIQYAHPGKSIAKRSKDGNLPADHLGRWPKTEDCLDDEKLKVEYTIKPMWKWDRLNTFPGFTIGNRETMCEFGVGEYLFINHSKVKSGSTEAERRPWVCVVLEIRGSHHHRVFLRVYWLYWPEHLPGGPKPHHSANELIMSNHMDIVDAETVAATAEVTRWDEFDDDEEVTLPLYWRHYYDTLTGQVTIPRKHCICKRPYNPTHILIACPNTRCNLWLHDECLLDNVLLRIYNRLAAKDVSKRKRLNEYIAAKQSKRPVKNLIRPWLDTLEAVLDSNSSPAKVTVTHLTEMGTPSSEEVVDLVCLKCKTPLD